MPEPSLPPKMILPPDGKQTRLDLFGTKPDKRSPGEWWNSLSAWFRHEGKGGAPDLDLFDEKLKKEGYSGKSRKSYLFMVKRFFDYFEHLQPGEVTMGEIEDYNFEFFVSGRYSRSYQLQFINAIKLYFLLTRGITLNLRQLRKTDLGKRTG